MNIIYTVGVDDVVAFNKHYASHAPHMKRMRKRTMIVATLFIFWLVALMSVFTQSWFIFLAGILATAAFAYTFPREYDKFIQRSVAKSLQEGSNKSTLGQHELEITDAGITERNAVTVYSTTWAGIEKIETTPTHAFIYLGSSMAHIIPVSSITTGHLSAFLDELHKRKDSPQEAGSCVVLASGSPFGQQSPSPGDNMKKWIIGAVFIAALGGGILYALFFPRIKISESTMWTCTRCGSTKYSTILVEKRETVQTNRYDIITERADGFALCQHNWAPGINQTNQTTKAQPISDVLSVPMPGTGSSSTKD